MSPDHPLTIVQINSSDSPGGAARVAWSLHQAYRRRGHRSILLVGHKHSDDPDVIALDRRPRRTLLARLGCALERRLGWQDLGRRPRLAALGRDVDIFHLHNLHGGYFDLGLLPALARQAPVVLTLHDMWAMTGHCAHALDCRRWQTGCGRCPRLDLYPAITADGTAFNWHRKRRLLNRRHVQFVAVSRWIRDQARQGLLRHRPIRLIPNGIDTDLYCPADRQRARHHLGLPLEAHLVLFSAHRGPANPWKDFPTLAAALRRLGPSLPSSGSLALVVLGGDPSAAAPAGIACPVIQRPFESDPARVAAYYQAADVLAYTTRADTSPLTLLEAAACALPVVASAVGGIPELIRPGQTGWLVPVGDAEALADRLRAVLADPAARAAMGANGRRLALECFRTDSMATAYLRLFAHLARRHPARKAERPANRGRPAPPEAREATAAAVPAASRPPYPRISLVMPSYNQAAFLEAALRSVLDQAYPDLELIVMDGGSTDGSVEIIRRWADRIAYWQSRPDGGQSRALNQGFARATGQVLGWLNSDDLLEPDALRRVAEACRGREHQALLVAGDGLFVDRDNRPVCRLPTAVWSAQELLEFYAGKHLSQPATFFTRAAWEAAGPLDESLHYAMDLDLWIRLRAQAAMVHVPAVLARMRLHAAAKTCARTSRSVREIKRVLRRHDGLLGPVARFWHRWRVRHASALRLCGEAASRAYGGAPHRAWPLLLEGLVYSPVALASGPAVRTLARLLLPAAVRRLFRPAAAAPRPSIRTSSHRHWRPLPAPAASPERISCIIPTYNRPAALRRTLESLGRQSVPPAEILVIDQSDTPQSLADFPRVRQVHCRPPNAQAARNLGARLAQGDLLLFLDDDIEASPGLVEAYLRLFADPRVGAASGQVLLPGQKPTGRFPSEFRWGATGWMRFPLNYAYTRLTRNFTSCNTCIRRRVHWATGGFDEHFPRTVFDDSDWSIRVCRALDRQGLVGLHFPEAWVLHWREPGGGRRPGPLNRYVSADAATWQTWFYFWLRHYGWRALADILHRLDMELLHKGLHRRPHWFLVAAACVGLGFWRARRQVAHRPKTPLNKAA